MPNTFDSQPQVVEPISVKTIAGMTCLNTVQYLLLPSLIKGFLKFYVQNFSNSFDALMGIDILRVLNANIDLKTNKIRLNNKVYDLELPNDQREYNNLLKIHEVYSIVLEKDDRFRTNHLNREEKTALESLLNKYEHLFQNKDNKLTFTNKIKHEILTKHEDPIYTKLYRYPQIHRAEVNRQIKEMLDHGIIQHSNSPYNSPLWVVEKKEDASKVQQWRLVVDYRKLNEVTVDDKYPIPVMEEILDKLGRCQYFTTLDLARGFYQVELDEKSRAKSAFSTEDGHYEFLRMPFGLKNAPATFQRLMNSVLSDLIGKDCLVYIDDVIVFSTSLQEHMISLEKVFKRLNEANLKIQLNKCEFLKRETEFLGHIVTKDGIRPNPKKITAILNFPIPKSTKEIKQFLGLAGFYRKFIKDFARITKPLTKSLKKDHKINPNDSEYVKAVETVKSLIVSDPILRYPDYNKKFTLTTDASNVALGAVLSQEGHPIAFASRTLNEHELNYSAIEKELLAVVWATQYFRPYIYGRKFVINSDHKPLQWLHNLKEPNSKLQRWKIKLNEYDFDIKHISGKENKVADALSRIKLVECYLNDDSSNVATMHSADEDNLNFISISERPINTFRRQFIFKRANKNEEKLKIIFKNTRNLINYIEMTEDFAKKFILEHLAGKASAVFFENDQDFLIFQSVYSRLITPSKNNKVYRCTKILEDLTTFDKFKEIILSIHLKGLHQGIDKVQNEFKQKYYYPNYLAEISKIINSCDLCNECKYDHSGGKIPFKITPATYEIREKYVIDLWKWDNCTFLTCIDVHSKFAMAEKLQHSNWLEAKRALLKIFNSMGPPKVLKTDQDSGLININLQEWCKSLNINVEITTGKNGIADIERLHKTLNEKLRIINTAEDQELKHHALEQVIFTYNHTISHSSTGETPYNIFFNKLQPTKNSQLLKEKRINNLNQNRHDHEIDIRFVHAENARKRLEKKANPFKRVQVVSSEPDKEHFKVKFKNRVSKKYKSHFKKKKKFVKPPTEVNESSNIICESYKSEPKSIHQIIKTVFDKGLSGLTDEYAQICEADPKFSSSAYEKTENSSKNRYQNIPCFDHTRVLLSKKNNETSNYIHANFVDSFTREKAYIATQGPLQNTMKDFWRMIWEQHCVIIVMLARIEEHGQTKCDQYWQTDIGKTLTLEPFSVKTIFIISKGDYVITSIELTNCDSNESRLISHYQYKYWPDQGIPNPLIVFEFLEQVQHRQIELVRNSFESMCPTHPKGPPIVVHCSAGIGRTGTFIALDIILSQFSLTHMVNIPEILAKLRSQRAYSISSPKQYIYCYLALIEYAIYRKLIKPVDLSKPLQLEKDKIFGIKFRKGAIKFKHPLGKHTKKLYNTKTLARI